MTTSFDIPYTCQAADIVYYCYIMTSLTTSIACVFYTVLGRSYTPILSSDTLYNGTSALAVNSLASFVQVMTIRGLSVSNYSTTAWFASLLHLTVALGGTSALVAMFNTSHKLARDAHKEESTIERLQKKFGRTGIDEDTRRLVSSSLPDKISFGDVDIPVTGSAQIGSDTVTSTRQPTSKLDEEIRRLKENTWPLRTHITSEGMKRE